MRRISWAASLCLPLPVDNKPWCASKCDVFYIIYSRGQIRTRNITDLSSNWISRYRWLWLLARWPAKPMSLSNLKWKWLAVYLWTLFRWSTWRHKPPTTPTTPTHPILYHPYPPLPSAHRHPWIHFHLHLQICLLVVIHKCISM